MNFSILSLGNVFVLVLNLVWSWSEVKMLPCVLKINDSSFLTLLSGLHLYYRLLFVPCKYVGLLFAFQKAKYEASEVCFFRPVMLKKLKLNGSLKTCKIF